MECLFNYLPIKDVPKKMLTAKARRSKKQEQVLFNCDKNSKIYYLDDYDVEPLSFEDLQKICFAFLRRVILDAGKKRRWEISQKEVKLSRDYLLNGYIESNKIVVEEYENKKQDFPVLTKKYPSHKRKSMLKLPYVLDVFNINHESFRTRILQWEKQGWSTDNPTYKFFEEIQ